jgi:hypothetical protein
MFRKLTVDAVKKAQDLPTLLWIGFLRTNHDDGSVSFYTKGLVEFGCMELEIVRSKKKPTDVFGLLHDTAQYLIFTGNVIKNGDTIGGDAEEKIKTRYADSEIDPDRKVIRIEY